MLAPAPTYVRPEFKRGRPTIGEKPMTNREHWKKKQEKKKQYRLDHIVILDMETDPFDAVNDAKVAPFLAVLYSDLFEPVVIWEEDQPAFVAKLLAAIEALPGECTIYAHNGGKFDYMFLLHQLRGEVMFKGRGIMSARIGRHQIRDSFHIIPEKLANYNKDDIDYSKMKRGTRNKHRKEIINYCISDCRYLLDIVKKFVGDHGLKLSIGQASMALIRSEYKFDRIGEAMDAYLRPFFFGGRVECLQGIGHWKSKHYPAGRGYKLYDVNSMYPDVMARYQHPIGNLYTVRMGARISPHCCFVELMCDNHGALISRGENNEASADKKQGIFQTTIHEYRVALKYGLISRVKILRTIDCNKFTDFSKVIVPTYENRLKTKALLKQLEREGLRGSYQHNEVKKDDMILKFLLNNMFGKFAQNPRRYKQDYLTAPQEIPPDEKDGTNTWGMLPVYECPRYWIWQRPNPFYRFNNVGTAASITGAARSVLMEAIANSTDPIYCDTDSLICRDLRGVEIDGMKLGAWDIERTFDEVIICAKKGYAAKVSGVDDGHKDRLVAKWKGASGLIENNKHRVFVWGDYEKLLRGETIQTKQRGATLTKKGQQHYLTRDIRATGGKTGSQSSRNTRQRVFA